MAHDLLHTTDESYLHANRRQIGLSPPEQGIFMTRDELQTDQEYMWQALFGKQRTTLMLAVEMLSRCQLSPEQILAKTISTIGVKVHSMPAARAS
jgi:hypothetical protein